MLNVTKFHSFLQNVLLQSVRVEVDIVDLFDFAQESTRNWKEGNEIFKNNHVIVVGVTKVAGESIHIFCSCLRGSNPSEPPREIRMVTSSELRNWEISCSCPAGKFRCKHQFACLLFIHRNKDLEILSATDVRQQWGKVAKIQAEALYEPVPLSGLCNHRKRNTSATVSDDLSSSIFNLFISELPGSALAKSMIGRNTLRPTESEMESSALPSAELHIDRRRSVGRAVAVWSLLPSWINPFSAQASAENEIVHILQPTQPPPPPSWNQ
nr:uncharacterized protein LOC115269642 [Aedes albopictus]